MDALKHPAAGRSAEATGGLLTLGWVAAATGGSLSPAAASAKRVRRISTDSRDVRPGDLFVCLPGPRFDGHDYAARALLAGAAAVLCSREPGAGGPTIRVADTRRALGDLARHLRGTVAPDGQLLVVGITGTNGKTTVKDLVSAVLAPLGPVVSSRRSFNNEIGVPLTLLELSPATRAAVVEIGTNGPGEIAALTAIVRPEVGLITNIGPGHLQGLGSIDGVCAEKGALLEGLVGRRVAVLNRDDARFGVLAARARGPVVSFGFAPESDVRAEDVRCDGDGTRFRVGGGRHEVRLAQIGRHAVSNALAALACALVAGVDIDSAVEALARVPSPPGRLQLRRHGDLVVVDDTYNANPASMRAALAAVREAGLPGRLVLVLGEMLELGPEAARLHREAGAAAAAARPAALVTLGEHAAETVRGATEAGLPADRASACPDREAAFDALARTLRGGDLVLLKGSRGMKLDELVLRLVQPRESNPAAASGQPPASNPAPASVQPAAGVA